MFRLKCVYTTEFDRFNTLGCWSNWDCNALVAWTHIFTSREFTVALIDAFNLRTQNKAFIEFASYRVTTEWVPVVPTSVEVRLWVEKHCDWVVATGVRRTWQVLTKNFELDIISEIIAEEKHHLSRRDDFFRDGSARRGTIFSQCSFQTRLEQMSVRVVLPNVNLDRSHIHWFYWNIKNNKIFIRIQQ